MDALASLARELARRDVRFVVIDVAGANYWALSGSTIFATRDRDLFLPLDADNLLRCWECCETVGLQLLNGLEPLDRPHDRWLAQRVVERRTAVRGTDQRELDIDLTLAMAGYDFETVWRDRRTFTVDDVPIPVARLLHIVRSKQAAGRDKDRLFLAAHREALEGHRAGTRMRWAAKSCVTASRTGSSPRRSSSALSHRAVGAAPSPRPAWDRCRRR